MDELFYFQLLKQFSNTKYGKGKGNFLPKIEEISRGKEVRQYIIGKCHLQIYRTYQNKEVAVVWTYLMDGCGKITTKENYEMST